MREKRTRPGSAIALTVALMCVAASLAAAPVSYAGAAPSVPQVRVSPPRWVVPAGNLPPEVTTQAGNNNVSIALHEGRLFLAWRTAPNHFASADARIYVVSSSNRGATWEFEREVFLGADVREPFLLSFDGRLILTCFEAGANMFAFEPMHMWRTVRNGARDWTELEQWGEEHEVPWAFQVEGEKAYLTTYLGHHYGLEPGVVETRFYVSDDGLEWSPVGEGGPVVYEGGVSEVGFAFDGEGNLWGVTRNEDGDASGFGSHVVFAPADDLANWQFPDTLEPQMCCSPRMFRHGEDVYLISRRDPCSPYDLGYTGLPFSLQRLLYLAAHSLRPKRTALYMVDRVSRKLVWMKDLPGCGDTAFPSIVQTGPDRFLVANYTSPLWFKWRTWLAGQISPFGTRIYTVELDFAQR